MKRIFILSIVFLFLISCVFAQEPNNMQSLQEDEIQITIDDSLNNTTLSQSEIIGLIQMREEEKLARDVYLELYDQWKLRIFKNIASSEQTHTDAIKRIIEKYNLEDPITDDTRGVFKNKEFTELYNSLTQKGSNSLIDALMVGATVEDLDIKDLTILLDNTNNTEIRQVYENLRKGSRNHLRSFSTQISNNNGTYTSEYISKEEYDAIISSEIETGDMLDKKNNIKEQPKNKNKQTPNGIGTNTFTKILPETASQIAQERLEINCDDNCAVELKQVGKKNQERNVYKVKTQKETKLLGLFKTKMTVQAQVDAETGEIVKTKKSWWSFLTNN